MDCRVKKKINQRLASHCMFYLPQGVPVMAIRNKMVLESLDPNLLEWVLTIISNSFMWICCTASKQLTNNFSIAADDSTPDAPVPDGGPRSAEDEDAAATSSDSESSFSDWHLSPSPQSFLSRASIAILSSCRPVLRKRSRLQCAWGGCANKSAWKKKAIVTLLTNGFPCWFSSRPQTRAVANIFVFFVQKNNYIL